MSNLFVWQGGSGASTTFCTTEIQVLGYFPFLHLGFRSGMDEPPSGVEDESEFDVYDFSELQGPSEMGKQQQVIVCVCTRMIALTSCSRLAAAAQFTAAC